MVTPEGGVKLMDFGLAKDRSESKLTQSGAVVGSLLGLVTGYYRGRVDRLDDAIDDDITVYAIITGIVSSDDPNYDGRNPPDVTVTNVDDGPSVSPAGV